MRFMTMLVGLTALFALPAGADAQVRGQPRPTPRDTVGAIAGGTGRPRERPAGSAALTVNAGTFMATRIDREALPLTDEVVDEDGTLYLIEFDRLVLSLRDDATFRASVRFRRTLFAKDPRGRSRPTPLQNMTVTGTYVVHNGEIRFTPDPSDETKGLRMLAGTVRNARELEVPFHYRNGTQERDRVLVMTRRDDIL